MSKKDVRNVLLSLIASVIAAFVLIFSSSAKAGPGEYGKAGCVIDRQQSTGLLGGTYYVPEITDDEPDSCGGWLLLPAVEYLNLPDNNIQTVDWDAVQWAFGATVLLWTIGLGIGWIYSIIKLSKK